MLEYGFSLTCLLPFKEIIFDSILIRKEILSLCGKIRIYFTQCSFTIMIGNISKFITQFKFYNTNSSYYFERYNFTLGTWKKSHWCFKINSYYIIFTIHQNTFILLIKQFNPLLCVKLMMQLVLYHMTRGPTGDDI